MVPAREPERGVTQHAMPAGDGVLQRDEQRVAQMQLAGDVGRRHDDAEGRLGRVRIRLEVPRLYPMLVPTPLDLSRLVGPGELWLFTSVLLDRRRAHAFRFLPASRGSSLR